MTDRLTVSLSLTRSLVQSQTTTVLVATLTDESDTPRSWEIVSGQVDTPAGAVMIGGAFSVGRGAVPAGGSLKVSAPVSFILQQQGNADPTTQQYDLTASFLTEDNQQVSGDGPRVTVLPPTEAPGLLPLNGALDFRSNFRSVLGLVLLEV